MIGPRFRVTLLGSSLFFGLLFVAGTTSISRASQGAPDVRSAQDLYKHSNRVIWGIVKSTKPGTHVETVGSGRVEFSTRETTIEVKKTFPFDQTIKPMQLLTIKELALAAEPVRDGEMVLWFLNGPSPDGLDGIVGRWAGDFRITKDAEGRFVALNRLRNRGLWRNDKSFWESFDGGFASKIKKQLEQHPTTLESVYDSVNRGCTPEPVRLDLLLAIASAKFPQPDKTAVFR